MVKPENPRRNFFLSRKRKGQAALEYMIIVTIALAMITPLIANSQRTVSSISQTRQTTMLKKSMDSVEKGSKLVRSQGEPARITMNIELPEGIIKSNVTGSRIYYRMELGSGVSDYYRFFDFNVSGELPESRGVHEIIISSEKQGVEIGYR